MTLRKEVLSLKPFLIKILKHSILKTYLWLTLEYFILLLTAAIIIVIGLSPELFIAYLIKEHYMEWFVPILLLGGIACTLLAFYLIGTHDKINSFVNSSVKGIKQEHQNINECKFLISCIKKVNRCSLTRHEENELEKFLAKLKVSIKEL